MDEENPVDLDLKRFQELSGIEIFQIMKLRQDIFVVEQKSAYADMDDTDPKSEHLFCTNKEGEIIAVTRIFPNQDGVWQIGRIAVKKAYRRRGIASQMMTFSKNYILENYEISKITLASQSCLVSYFGRYGFKVSSDEYLEENIPHIDMIYYVDTDQNKLRG